MRSAKNLPSNDQESRRVVRSLPKHDKFVAAMALITVVAALGLPVNPWPEDGWFQTLFRIVGDFRHLDNYTPIAAPAFLFRAAHEIAGVFGLGLAGTFYIASLFQNVLILFSACFLYYTLRRLQMKESAGLIAVLFLLLVLSTGLPQAFWSESVVLFCMAAVLLIFSQLLDTSIGVTRFWVLSATCGFLIGALVVTRMTPIFLIPALAVMLFGRMPLERIVKLVGVSVAFTAFFVVAMMVSNHARYGRYELTHSSGRHLWQGVREFSDRALADSAEYRALKALDPEIQGKNWWELPFPRPRGSPFTRDGLLGDLAKEAILNEPDLYIAVGIRKFLGTIGDVPSRLGLSRSAYNPLATEEFLPPLAAMRAPIIGKAVQAAFATLHAMWTWLYPVTIFAIAVSYAARLKVGLAGAYPAKKWFLDVGFVVFGLLVALLPVSALGPGVAGILVAAGCVALLAVGIRMQRMSARHVTDAPNPVDLALFTWLALFFFGSLWFSWQVESANPRNAVPYLPFWGVMLGMATLQWRQMCAPVSVRDSVT